ncbi:MAG: hypothetical protein AB1333_04675 [Patescibacteria group bacterium]
MNRTSKIKCRVLPCSWRHHLIGGGWGDISKELKKVFHDNRSPIDLYTAYEYQVRERVSRPFVAFFHQVVSGYERSLKKILNSKVWEHNQKFFLGGFVFSKNQLAYIEKKIFSQPIRLVLHPTPMKVKRWYLNSFLKDPTFLHAGIHCRNVDFFVGVANQRQQREKYILLAPRKRDYTSYLSRYPKTGIEIKSRMSNVEYNEALASSVVFINLLEAAANNTILECIARGTPLLVNNIGGVEDYLGKKYPLYYGSTKHAEQIIGKIKRDPSILNRAHAYLLKRRQKFLMQRFLQQIESGLKTMIKNYDYY